MVCVPTISSLSNINGFMLNINDFFTNDLSFSNTNGFPLHANGFMLLAKGFSSNDLLFLQFQWFSLFFQLLISSNDFAGIKTNDLYNSKDFEFMIPKILCT